MINIAGLEHDCPCGYEFQVEKHGSPDGRHHWYTFKAQVRDEQGRTVDVVKVKRCPGCGAVLADQIVRTQ